MEKRHHPRVHCEIESDFKNLTSVPGPAPDSVSVNDLSEGGIRFRSNRFIPAHQRLLFRLQIPKSALIETWSELAWIRELPHLNCYEAGARFVDFPSQHKSLLRNFIFQRFLTI